MPQQNAFYSEEAQEIMGRMPPRLVRWGLAYLFFIFLIILGICFFIHYPQTISGPIVIESARAEEGVFVGRMTVSSHNLGKIEIGQPVRIRLHAYPAAEYGLLRGLVEQLSPVAGEIGRYRILISLPNGLQTSQQGRAVRPIPQMDGTAEIIIANPRLIERLLSPFNL